MTGTPAQTRGPQDANRRGFRQAQAELVVTGVSPYGFVTVRSFGLLSWAVDIREGTRRQLSEQEFIQEAPSTRRPGVMPGIPGGGLGHRRRVPGVG